MSFCQGMLSDQRAAIQHWMKLLYLAVFVVIIIVKCLYLLIDTIYFQTCIPCVSYREVVTNQKWQT